MPDMTNATSVRRAKRGFRRLSMMLRAKEYEQLEQMAEQESRSPDQQAAYLLRKVLAGQDARIPTDYTAAEENGTVPQDAEEPTEGVAAPEGEA